MLIQREGRITKTNPLSGNSYHIEWTKEPYFNGHEIQTHTKFPSATHLLPRLQVMPQDKLVNHREWQITGSEAILWAELLYTVTEDTNTEGSHTTKETPPKEQGTTPHNATASEGEQHHKPAEQGTPPQDSTTPEAEAPGTTTNASTNAATILGPATSREPPSQQTNGQTPRGSEGYPKEGHQNDGDNTQQISERCKANRTTNGEQQATEQHRPSGTPNGRDSHQTPTADAR